MEISSSFIKDGLSNIFLSGGKEGIHFIRKGTPFELTTYELNIGGKMEKHNFVTCQGLDANKLVACGAAVRESNAEIVSFCIPESVKVQVTRTGEKDVTDKEGNFLYRRTIWDYQIIG